MTNLQRLLCAGAAAAFVAAAPPMVEAQSGGEADRTYTGTQALTAVENSVYKVGLYYQFVLITPDGKIQVNESGQPQVRQMLFATGSAVLIGSAPGYKYFSTNHHVLNYLDWAEGKPVKVVGRVVKLFKPGASPTLENGIAATAYDNFPDSERMDIAFIQASDASITGDPVKIVVDPPPALEPIEVIGYPGAATNSVSTEKEDPSAAPGQVSRIVQGFGLTGVQGAPYRIIQTNAAINHGNSGGGLFDNCGGLVAIPDYGPDKSKTEGINFAIGANEMLHMLPPNVTVTTVRGGCVPATIAPTPVVADDSKKKAPAPIPAAFIFAGVAGIAALALGGVAYVNMRSKPKTSSPAVAKEPPAPDPLRLPPATGVRLMLTGKDGNGANQRLEVNKAMVDRHPDGVVLGREPAAGNVRLPDDRPKALVSREHARFSLKGDHFQIEDARSSNGTFLNGEKLTAYQPRPLRTGDKVRFADLEFIVDIN
jgi:S1-C subfamily serine protease